MHLFIILQTFKVNIVSEIITNCAYLDVTVISNGLHMWRAVLPEFLGKYR